MVLQEKKPKKSIFLPIVEKKTYVIYNDEHPIEKIYPSIACGQRITPVSEIIERLEKQKNYPFLPFVKHVPSIVSLLLDNQYKKYIQQIYLFGSYAYGEPDIDSDIDFFVIIDDSMVKIRMDICMEIKRPLRKKDIIPCDLLVYNKETFDKYKNETSMAYVIKKWGVLIYERK